MKRLHMERKFNTTQQKLWELIVDADHYRNWTKAFSEGSDFVGDWSKGSRMRFVAEDESDNENGMLSEIVESIWPEFISIRHLGLVMDGVEDYDSPSAKKWTPAFENYRLTSKEDGSCTFELDQEIPDEEFDGFKESWRRAFNRISNLLEESEDVGRVITLREKSSRSVDAIWDRLVVPEKVMTWNYASDDWHCPKASNNLIEGREFHYEMAAKDGSMSFDFWGTYTLIEPNKKLYFDLGDGRKVRIDIIEKPYGCLIEERFEVEQQNNLDLQRKGWQSILRNLAG